MKLIEVLGDAIERNAVHAPDGVFLSCDGRDQTFAEYACRVRQFGSAMSRAGARKQDRVALLSFNSIECVETYGLADLCGFILVLVNARLAGPEMRWILQDSEPVALVFEHGFTDIVNSIRQNLASVTTFVCIGGSVPPWAIEYEAFIAGGDAAGPPFRAGPRDYDMIMYTSGTTGRPKGVLLGHKQQAAMGLTQGIEYGSAPGTAALIVMPLFHNTARSLYLAQLLQAGRVVIHRRFEAQRALEEMHEQRIAILSIVPTMLLAMMAVEDFARYDLSAVRSIMSAGASMPIAVLRRAIEAFGPVFLNGYGQTEGGGTVLRCRDLRLDGTDEERKRIGSVGQAMLHTQIRILDDEGNDVADGALGEICLRSDQVMEGYWNNHPATLTAIRNGWLHTGDIGYRSDGGYLYLVDRKKDMIISGGENVYSTEVENALAQHPAVHEVAVIGLADAKWGEAVTAIISVRPGTTIEDAALKTFARMLIADFKCPKRIIVLEELPHNASGKIDKKALREQFAVA
jgi:acyl-CoA synthetase (AMP-forming)/AMP-acid ligase II